MISPGTLVSSHSAALYSGIPSFKCAVVYRVKSSPRSTLEQTYCYVLTEKMVHWLPLTPGELEIVY